MKVAFYTLGCKVNAYETEAIMEMFKEAGYEIVDYQGLADVYVVNSCMVTNSGERKSKQIIRRPYQLNKDAIVIVMGCLSQLKADQMLKIDGVKIVLGTKNRDQMIVYLERYLKDKKPINAVDGLEKDDPFDRLAIRDFEDHKRAFLKIQDGCNNFCTYCIIPYTRGRIRSKAKDVILAEVKELVEHGHKEIVLTGIHTGGYGQDFDDYSFADLLRDLEKVDGLERIRISSIEITELDDFVLSAMRDSKKLVNHLHIPLQSGSNRILKRMNRKYTTLEYKAKIKEIREIFSDIAITTDVIVGFPGEDENDFEEAYQTIKDIAFQELHVFPYSRRQGTPADKMKDQVHGRIKKERVHRLLELSDVLKANYLNQQVGRMKTMIIEQEKDGYLLGHTSDYIAVKLKADPSLIGQLVHVKIDAIDFPHAIASLQKK